VLSKFARIAHQFAHRLQLQERLTHQIADEIERITGSRDVAVVGQGEHLCMTMRGIKTEATMSSSVIRGRFRDLPALRAEMLALMGRR
jgi:GTP cyclohydrolase I